MASLADFGNRALITHFDAAVGGTSAAISMAIPDEALSLLGKLAVGVATAVLSTFVSGLVRSWQDRRRHRRNHRKE